MKLTTGKEVSLLELKRLLHSLKDSRPDICIRFRMIGEMWQNHYCRIIDITEKGVTLNDEKFNKLIFIKDLKNVMQFDLDHAFQQYEPHFHYSINLSL